MDENVLPFQSKINDKTPPNDSTLTSIDDLKSSLDQRLKEKHDKERLDNIQAQKTTEKLVTGLLSTLSLGKKTTADMAVISEKNRLLLNDNAQLTLKYDQARTHNQQLTKENTTLQTKLDIAEKNITNLNNLSTDLSHAMRRLDAQCTGLAIKLGQSSASQAQLHKDLSIQSAVLENATRTNHTLEKKQAALIEKINLLRNIFGQGHALLNPAEPKPQTNT